MAVNTLTSFVTDEPYVGQRLGILAPGILRDVGDVADLAALTAPRRVVIAGGVAGNGKALTADQLKANYSSAAKRWELLKAEKNFVLTADTDAAKLLETLGGK